MPRPQALHVRHHSGKGRSAFLTAIPTRPELLISPQLTRVLIRNRLAIRLEGTPARCSLCDKPSTSPVHLLDCFGTRSQERLHVHNAVRAGLERIARIGGGQFRTEPPLDHHDDRHRRADTQLFLPAIDAEQERQIFLDVQVINPLAQSHISSFSDVPTIIARAEKLKRSKYAKAAQGLNAEFVPFILTIQGEIGPAASALMESLENRARTLLNMDCKLFLTLTLQRAVARAQTWARLRCFANRWRGQG
jgi:hypothetical protein